MLNTKLIGNYLRPATLTFTKFKLWNKVSTNLFIVSKYSRSKVPVDLLIMREVQILHLSNNT